MLVYKATDTENGKVYIGATTKKLEERKRRHIKDSSRDGRSHYRFASALRNREDKFEWEVLRECETKDEMWKFEDYYIQMYDSMNPEMGYNMNGGGQSGIKTQETRDKIGAIGKWQWETGNCAKDKIEAGRQKAIKAWQKKCMDARIEFICPVCGKRLLLQKNEYEKRTYCSRECANVMNNYDIGLREANKVNAEIYREKCNNVKEIVELWKQEYKDDIISCKLNRISPVLEPLCNMCEESVGIKDFRSIIKCYVGKYIYRKDFIKMIKESY